MKKKSVSSVLNMIKGLSEEQKNMLSEQILKMLSSSQNTRNHMCNDLIGSDIEKPDCPHCGAKAKLGYIVKNGQNRGAQRYLYKSCGKKFVPTTNTVFARTRKDADTWRKYVKLTISGKSLHECAEECDIGYQTAFTWRHKILNAFVANQNKTKMNGIIEVDEMLIPLSYKGNHVPGEFGGRTRVHGTTNGLPRPAFKRGTDNKSMSSKDKACVFCMVGNNNSSYFAAVPGVGFMNEQMLDATVGAHVVKEDSMMLADEYKITKKYFESNGYTHEILSSNTSDNPHDHKPEVKDGLHIQHVNAMHHHIRNFLRPYCGVSSKYLGNYVAMFVWLKNIAKSTRKKEIDKVSLTRAFTPDCYITRKEIDMKPAIPVCA